MGGVRGPITDMIQILDPFCHFVLVALVILAERNYVFEQLPVFVTDFDIVNQEEFVFFVAFTISRFPQRWTPILGQVGSGFKVESAVEWMLPD